MWFLVHNIKSSKGTIWSNYKINEVHGRGDVNCKLKFLTHKIHCQSWNSKLIWDIQRLRKKAAIVFLVVPKSKFQTFCLLPQINFQHKNSLNQQHGFQIIDRNSEDDLGPPLVSPHAPPQKKKQTVFLFQTKPSAFWENFQPLKSLSPTPLASILRTYR